MQCLDHNLKKWVIVYSKFKYIWIVSGNPTSRDGKSQSRTYTEPLDKKYFIFFLQ